jgi:hypothetical protein
LRGISDVAALTLINRFLSILSWSDDQPMENRYGWSGNPVPVAVPRESKAVGSSIAFPFGRRVEPDEKASFALALFREGRTVNSTPFEFLSYFKILNIFWKDKWLTINGHRQNPLIEGIRATLPKLRDDLAVSGFAKPSYVAAQGTALQRTDRVHVRKDGEEVWVGGDVVDVIRGEINL